MGITRFEAGARMSQAVIHGNTVYTAGQVAQGTRGGTVTEQTTEILARIDALLARAGT
ncbi:MAG: RidA family protein, partial [Gammaproteobacteria bacterium]|nr:RidA family protein [Gammaproteobacteria bacterium]